MRKAPSKLLLGLAVLTLPIVTLAQFEDGPVPLTGWSGTIRHEYQARDESSSEHPLQQYIQGTYLDQSSDREVTVYSISDGTAKFNYSLERLRYSRDDIQSLGTCDWTSPIRLRTVSSVETKEDVTEGAAEGPAECYLDAGENWVTVECNPMGATVAITSTQQSEVSCSGCCGSRPGETTTTTAEPLSTTVDEGVPGGYFAQETSEELPIPGTLVGSEVTVDSDGKGQHTLSWSLRRSSDYLLELEPQPAKIVGEQTVTYENWRPKASLDELEPGNGILIKATLKRKDGAPLDLFAKTIKFELTRRSFEPGVAMNWPPVAIPLQPDLQFDPERNAELHLEVGGHKNSTAITEEDTYDHAYAIVSSYDWGAHGVLEVEATLADNTKVYGEYAKTPGKRGLLLPWRENEDDPIAHSWRTAWGVGSADARTDDETTPGNDHPGDGLSLYEEYRGFHVNGLRKGTSPKDKDLFVRNEIGVEARPGLDLYEAKTGIWVHEELTALELPATRQINRNSSGTYQSAQQHGLVLKVGPPGQKYSIAKGTGPGTPKQTKVIEIMWQMTNAGRLDSGRRFTLYDSTVAHEVGHASNLWHHGTTDLGVRRWSEISGVIYEGAEKDLSTTTDGKTPITVVSEQTGEVLDAPTLQLPLVVYLGVDNGQHSGVENCFMRYDAASAIYRHADPSRRIRYTTPEAIGTGLCTQRTGTGVNDRDRQTLPPRYGDAYLGRGNCLGQLCINDAHAH